MVLLDYVLILPAPVKFFPGVWYAILICAFMSLFLESILDYNIRLLFGCIASLGIASLCLSSLSLSFENFLLLPYILGFKIFSSFFLLSFLRHFLEVFICCSVS